MERWLGLVILIYSCPVHSFFNYPPIQTNGQYPVQSVPRGYQPPPDPPLASEYYLNGASIPQNQWNQQQTPPHNQWNQQQTPPQREPVLINTVIQVYTNDNAPQLFSEMRTLSSVSGNQRVEISRNTTLDTNYGTLVRDSAANHGNVAHVRAFAATNNTRVTKEELEKELDRELEKAIPFILDELDKTTTAPPATTAHTDKDVTNEDLEKLIGDALNKIKDDKLREKERAELEKARKLTEPVPQTTLPAITSTRTTSYKTTTSHLPTTNEQTTAKLIVFERTTTPSSETDIPEAESDTPEHELHWVTATPMSGPPIVTKIINFEPVKTTPEPVSQQQQDNTASTEENPSITMFHREQPTVPPTSQQTEMQTEETIRTDSLPEMSTVIPQEQSTQQQEQSTQQQEQSTRTATPVLILTQSTENGQQTTGKTEEFIVPHHAVNAESSETHPRTWKPHHVQTSTTELHRVVPTTITPSEDVITTEVQPELPSSPEQAESTTSFPMVTTIPTVPSQELTTLPSSEAIPQTVNEPQEECPVPNDPNEPLRGDVLFLLDGSSSVGEERFENAKKLIHDAVKQFKNVGASGIQVSLIQFNGEPFLEFSFRAHNCITNLLEDISDTGYINGASDISKAIEKSMKFAYTKARGDRSDAPNVIVLITDGQSDGNVQVPVELIRKNDTTFLVIATVKARPSEVASLAKDADLDLFNLTDANTRPLAIRLASRIEDVIRGKHVLSLKDTTNFIASATPPIESTPVIGGNQDDYGERSTPSIVLNTSEVTTESGDVESNTQGGSTVGTETVAREFPASYQDENVQINCLSDGVRATFQVPESFAGVLSAKDHINVTGCSVNIPLINRDSSTVREVSLVIRSNQCGLNVIKSESPRGVNNSIVINLFHNSELVTAQDRSYVVQCFVPDPEPEQRLETRLEVEGVTAYSKTVSLNSVPPSCDYTLRRDTPNGPVLQTASIGQIVYHRWECKSSDEINSAYGLHIHDCWASNGSAHGYEIVDKSGCSADPSLLSEITYADDRILAHVKSYVFSFIDIPSLLFSCKLSLCLREKDGCEGVSPPVCRQSNFSELLLTRRARHYNAFDAALTVDVETQQVSITDPMRAEKKIHLPTDMKVGILLLAFLVGSCMGMCCFFWRKGPGPELSKRTSVFNDELPIVMEEPQRNANARPSVVFATDSLVRKASMTGEGYLPM